MDACRTLRACQKFGALRGNLPAYNEFMDKDDVPDLARRFGGVARLYGGECFARFVQSHAVIVGIGGVGSWAAEALARSGVGRITLIDLDHLAESNTNRQIHALGDEYGKAKVAAMAARIGAINPACRVVTIEEFITVDNVAAVLPDAQIVLDCIDDVRAKAALIANCRERSIPIATSGGAGGRVDPTRIRRDDLARVHGDPLLSKLRYRLRHDYGFPRETSRRVPKFGVVAVFTDEPVRTPAQDCDPDARLACAGFGSSVAVTAPLGFAAAAVALEELCGGQTRS
jgi:tRNA A37 threonylcarbamoyladenosine dehydratase